MSKAKSRYEKVLIIQIPILTNLSWTSLTAEYTVWIGLQASLDGGYQWVDGSPTDYVSWEGELFFFVK